MKKRGQITLIMIAVLVLVATFILVYHFQSSLKEEKAKSELSKSLKADFQPVINYARESLQQIAIEAIIKIGEQGGRLAGTYDFLPRDVGSGKIVNVAYGFRSGTKMLPDLNEMENELAEYIKTESERLNFDELSRTGYIIDAPSKEEIKAKAAIGPETALFEINYPLRMSLGNYSDSEEKFAISIPVKLGRMHEMGMNLINDIINGGAGNIDLSVPQSKYDFSCDKLRIAYEPGNFIKISDYNPFFAKSNLYSFQFAIEAAELVPDRLSCIGTQVGTSCSCP